MSDHTPFDFDPAPSMRNAACRHQPTDLFFPERGVSSAEAKAICAACPVKLDCLEYSLEIPQLLGVWAGLSVRERRAIRLGRRPRPYIRHGTETGYKQHRKVGEEACQACKQAHSAAVQQRKNRPT